MGAAVARHCKAQGCSALLLIDKDAELARITKAMEKIEKDVSRTRGKLGNEKFVSNAPEAVIEKERAKLEEGEKALAKLKEQFETIKAL